MSCPFGAFCGQPGSRDCWTERHANAMRGSSSSRPQGSPPVRGAMREPPCRIAYAMRVLLPRHAPDSPANDRVMDLRGAALRCPARRSNSTDGVPAQRIVHVVGLSDQLFDLFSAPFTDHRVAFSGRQEPGVAKHPNDQRRQRRRNSARYPYPAFRVARERHNRLADELGGQRVVRRGGASDRRKSRGRRPTTAFLIGQDTGKSLRGIRPEGRRGGVATARALGRSPWQHR